MPAIPADATPSPPPPATGGLNAAALLNRALDLVRAHPLPILGPLVLLGALTGGGDRGPAWRYDLDFGSPAEALVLLPFFALMGIAALVILILLFFLYTIAYLVTTRAAFDADEATAAPDLGHAWNAIRPRIGGGAGTFLLWLVIVVVGFILLVAPGFIAMAGLLPIAAVVVAEARVGPDALRRAWDLTKGHKWDLFLVVLVVFVGQLLVSALLGWLPILGGVLAGAASGALNAFAATAAAVFYRRKVGAAPPAAVV